MTAPQLLLAFDFGTRRIGVAAGDTLTQTARPLTTLEYTAAIPWTHIGKLIADYQPARLIVGLPSNMDGTDTEMTKPSRAFAHGLRERFKLPVALVDERLTSKQAERELKAARASGLKKRRTVHADIDMVAAKLVLERWYIEGPVQEL